MKKVLFLILLLISFFTCIAQNTETQFEIQEPENYLLSKFQQHDIVILGEHHWMKNELIFLKNVIPLLYANGVRCFAFEFLAFTTQNKIDSMINSENFSKSLRDSIIAEKSHWQIKEYMDILYILWQINKNNSEKITVLGLDAPSSYPRPFNNDSLMGNIVIDYYSQMNSKILIYCGKNHAFTKFHQCQPITDSVFEPIQRLGNIIYNKFSDKVTNIHFLPWIYFNVKDNINRNNEIELKELIIFSYIKKNKNNFGMDLQNLPVSNSIEVPDYLQRCPDYSMVNVYDGGIFLNEKIKFCKINKNLSKEYKNAIKRQFKLIKNAKIIKVETEGYGM